MKVFVLLVSLLVAVASAAPRSGFAQLGFSAGRVVGGREATPHEFPWQVSLQWNFLPGLIPRGQHTCGGSIIRENVILTAGHCSVGLPIVGRYEILAGKHKLDTTEASEQKVQVGKLIVHEKYGNRPVVGPYDIALMVTDKSLTLTNEVQLVSLPETDAIPTGEATLSGWGSTSTTQSPSMPNALRKVSKPLLDYKECQSLMNELIGSDNPLHECNQCTGPLTGGVSACSGDSGGPLVQTTEEKTTLIGVVSWGFMPCGTNRSPSVYTRVSYFTKWIQDNLA